MIVVSYFRQFPVFNEARGFGSLIPLPRSPSKPFRPQDRKAVFIWYADILSAILLFKIPIHIAIGVALCNARALIEELFTLCNCKLYFDFAVFKVDG